MTRALPATVREASRIGAIDAMRGIAILLVFFMHGAEIAAPLPGAPAWPMELGQAVDFGRMGVVLFFAISGFVIPITLRREPGRGLGAFAINRAFRLYPAFWLSIIPSAATHFWIVHHRFALGAFLLNATMLPRWLGGLMANGGYWTLEVEFVFYALCGLIFLAECERKAFVFALIGLVCGVFFLCSQPSLSDAVPPGRFHPDVFRFTLHLAIMMWGAIIRLWWEGARVDPLSRLLAVAFAAWWCLYEPGEFAIAVWTGAFADVDTKMISAYGGGLALFLLGLWALRRPPAWLLWCGRVSYSLYLFHAPVTLAIVLTLRKTGWLPAGVYWIAVALAAGCSLGVAQLVFTYVERPSIRIGHRLARGRGVRAAAVERVAS